jgi:chitin disaccharide deacetylase
MKKIIINADDFGLNHSVNLAVANLYQKKALSSTTLMVDLGESSLEAVKLAKEYKIPVGLHFNLTYNNKQFATRRDFEKKYLSGKIDKKQIYAELVRQYQWLINQGIQPTHIDSHQHVHTWPGIFAIVAQFAKQKNLPVRISAEYIIFNRYDQLRLKSLKQLLRKSILYILTRINKLQALWFKVPTNRNMVSIFALWPRPTTLTTDHLKLLLHKAKHQDEYMCHPSISAEAMENYTSIGNYSGQEYGLMTNQMFLDMISEQHTLISFGELS